MVGIVSSTYEVLSKCLLVFHFLKVQIWSVHWEYLSLQADSLNQVHETDIYKTRMPIFKFTSRNKTVTFTGMPVLVWPVRFLPLGTMGHQILIIKVIVNIESELGTSVRWIQCFVYNAEVAEMSIYYPFLHLRISSLKMPEISLSTTSFAVCHRFFWSGPLTMGLDPEALVMQRCRDCSGGGVCSKIKFLGSSGSGVTVAILWWLGTEEAGSWSWGVLTRLVLLPDFRRCSWHPPLVFHYSRWVWASLSISCFSA